MAHDVFISYCASDETVAMAVCSALENCGIRSWIAPRDVTPGLPYAECLINAIAGSDVFVLVFSDGVNASPHVMREVERAVAKEIPIIPFRIENAEPRGSMEYFLSSPHWLDAVTPPIERHLHKLVAVTREVLALRRGAEKVGLVEDMASTAGEKLVPVSSPARQQGGFSSLGMPPVFSSIDYSFNWVTRSAWTLGATIVLYGAAFFPLSGLDSDTFGAKIGSIFTGRGFMPYVMTIVFCWSVVTLWSDHFRFREFAKAITAEAISTQVKVGSLGDLGAPSHGRSGIQKVRLKACLQSIRRAVIALVEAGRADAAEDFVEPGRRADVAAIKGSHPSIKASILAILGCGLVGALLGAYEVMESIVDLMRVASQEMDSLNHALRSIAMGAYALLELPLLSIAMSALLISVLTIVRKREINLCLRFYSDFLDRLASLGGDSES